MSSQDPLFFENILIKFLYKNEDVRDRVMPYLDIGLFDDKNNIELIKHIFSFNNKYDRFPTIKESRIDLKSKEVHDHLLKITQIDVSEYEHEFLLDEIESFLKKKIIWNLSLDIAENINNDAMDEIGDIPDKLREAHSFSFDTSIGLNIFNEEDRLYNFFHEKKHIIPTGLKDFDNLINGGYHAKSLTLFLAGTNVGKSLVMASSAVSNVLMNKKVLYVSCELSEEMTGQRILSNIFDVPMDDLKLLPKSKFHEKYEKIGKSFRDKIIIKEYPSKSINANAIRNLLKDLKMKMKFEPDIIYIDQIENMNPIHRSRGDNTYTEMKKVTNESRSLGSEYNLPIVSGIQTDRKGITSTELDLDNTGESIGFVQIADVVVAMTQSDELRSVGKYSWQLLKNRYGINRRKITVCVNYEKMRIFDDPDNISNNIGTPPPPTEKENEEKEKSAITDVKSILKKNKKIRDNKVIEFE